ncbi:MAG: TIGR01244 family sulfur transferase [Pseudomonadota bacterium]
MEIKRIAPDIGVSSQLAPQDIGAAAAQGYKTIIINRPDGESDDQPDHAAIQKAAMAQGLRVKYLPVVAGKMTDADVSAFAAAMRGSPAPALAYCRTGTRSATLWALSQAGHLSADAILGAAADAGYDLSALRPKLEGSAVAVQRSGRSKTYDIVIVGGGAAGIATASSILKRRKTVNIAIIEPRTEHYYQPGWTLVGGGVFKRENTQRQMARVMPRGVHWIRAACAAFAPQDNKVILEDGERIAYKTLVVAPGLKLAWDKIDGLRDTLGKNGVTSNYLFDMAPYTWELVQSLKGGKALFTQPPMPIKCAGAPQKAMYLSCDAWRRSGALQNIDVSFHNAGGVLFGVSDYVPALTRYVERYGVNLNFNENLVAVDGPSRKATFEVSHEGGETKYIERDFDMLHVCPPQTAPDFIAESPLANDAGWVDVDPETLQHVKYGNVFSVGDANSAPNAKTAAAVRKQAPVVAVNILRTLEGEPPHAVYNGYGSCPLTVERGRVVLAEFAYGGKLDPTFPSWFLKGTEPTWKGWFAKANLMPWLYFDLMLKGREWLAKPKILPHRPVAHAAAPAISEGKGPAKAA